MEHIHTVVTKHAKQRLKERANAKGSASEKMAQRAYENGLTLEETSGPFHK